MRHLQMDMQFVIQSKLLVAPSTANVLFLVMVSCRHELSILHFFSWLVNWNQTLFKVGYD